MSNNNGVPVITLEDSDEDNQPVKNRKKSSSFSSSLESPKHKKKEHRKEGTKKKPVFLSSDSSEDETKSLTVKTSHKHKSKGHFTEKKSKGHEVNLDFNMEEEEEELPDILDYNCEDSFFAKKLSKEQHNSEKKKYEPKVKLPKKIIKPSAVSLSEPTVNIKPTSINTSPNKPRILKDVPLTQIYPDSEKSSYSRSPSKSKSPKKKTPEDIQTNIHDTSTDEIDSDEINSSLETLNNSRSPTKRSNSHLSPQPCSSKSLLSTYNKEASKESLIQNGKKISPLPCYYVEDEDDILDDDPTFANNVNSVLYEKYHNSQGMHATNHLMQSSSKTQIKPTSHSRSPPKDHTKHHHMDYGKSRIVNGSTSQLSSTSEKSSAQSSQVSSSSDHYQKKVHKRKADSTESERKRREKEIKKLERETRKAEEAKAKELKKVQNEVQRSTKNGEAEKFMTILIDKKITDKIDTLIPQLVAKELKYDLEDEPTIQNSITFKRELVHVAMDDNLNLQKVSTFQEENQMMILIESDELITMAYAQIHEDEDCGVGLSDWIQSIKAACPTKKITLYLYDVEKYFKHIKRSQEQEYRNRVRNGGDQPPKKKRNHKTKDLPKLTRSELDFAMTQVQASTLINCREVKNAKELAECLRTCTKAIANAPFNQQRTESTGFNFHAVSNNTGTIKVEKDGVGLRKLWTSQFQEFNGVNSDMAKAIVNEYPSPKSLVEAYEKCKSVEQQQALLQDITFTSGPSVLARTRKVGFERSKQIARFFTSTNGDRILGSSADMR